MSIPKYSKVENERRWLMPVTLLDSLKGLAYQKIEDLYLAGGRLRLRSMIHSEANEGQFKLCKKYGAISDSAEPIVNIYLDIDEYFALSALPGRKIAKRRYNLTEGSARFGVDVFEGELSNLILCEYEADSEESLNLAKSPEDEHEHLVFLETYSYSTLFGVIG